LGEFSPIWAIGNFGLVLKITEVVQVLVHLSFTVKVMYQFFLQNMGWSAFWAIFSQTHLVTLAKKTALLPGANSTTASCRYNAGVDNARVHFRVCTFIENCLRKRTRLFAGLLDETVVTSDRRIGSCAL
jgi:hypothetical protein